MVQGEPTAAFEPLSTGALIASGENVSLRTAGRAMISELFDRSLPAELGQRLGTSFVRAQQEKVSLVLKDGVVVEVSQSSMGIVAISGIIWDAGLLVVDYLLHRISAECSSTDERVSVCGRTLDLGCGTGICGIAAALLGATVHREGISLSSKVTFSDCIWTSTLEENLCLLEDIDGCMSSQFISYDWTDGASLSASGLTETVWDTIVCSDVLYESKMHVPLMSLLRRIPFKQMWLSYKRRHDTEECKFLTELGTWCDIEVVNTDEMPLVNLPSRSALRGLYLFIVRPHQQGNNVVHLRECAMTAATMEALRDPEHVGVGGVGGDGDDDDVSPGGGPVAAVSDMSGELEINFGAQRNLSDHFILGCSSLAGLFEFVGDEEAKQVLSTHSDIRHSTFDIATFDI